MSSAASSAEAQARGRSRPSKMSTGAKRCLRLVLGVVACNFCLQGWLPPMPFEDAPRGFVIPANRPEGRQSRTARGAAAEDDALAAENERLKQELAALRGQAQQPAPAGVPPAATPPAAAPVPDATSDADDKFTLRSTVTQVLEDMKDSIKEIEDARLGFTEDGNFMYAQDQGDPAKNVIFKRKSEVLQASLGQQEACLKAISGAARKGKELESLKMLVEIEKKNKKDVEYKALKSMYMEGNQWVDIVFKDIVPKAMEDPVADTLIGLGATALLVGASVAACLCLFPPFIPPDN